MKWINADIAFIDNDLVIMKSVPDDIFHLELDSKDSEAELENHPPYKYFYIITDKLSLYKDDDDVKYLNWFYIKNSDNKLVKTKYKITDYIDRW